MPLVGFVNGQRTVSSLLSDAAWRDLQEALRAGEQALTLRCGRPGHTRANRFGTRFFAHNPTAEDSCRAHGRETPQHLLLKSLIVQAATEAGWDAEPEVTAPSGAWRADVLARRGKIQVAFEVQWSHQTYADYAARQRAYDRDGVRCAWFTAHSSSVPPVATRDLPIFALAWQEERTTVALQASGDPSAHGNAQHKVGTGDLPLTEMVKALLSRRVQHRMVLGSSIPMAWRVDVYASSCSRCQKTFGLWNVTSRVATGACGQTSAEDLVLGLWQDSRPEAMPAVRRTVHETLRNTGLPSAGLQRRRTRMSGSQAYMAFYCPRCNYTFGDWFLRDTVLTQGPVASLTVPTEQMYVPAPHWCLSRGGEHCPDVPGEPAPDPSAPVGPPPSPEASAQARLLPGPDLPPEFRQALGGWRTTSSPRPKSSPRTAGTEGRGRPGQPGNSHGPGEDHQHPSTGIHASAPPEDSARAARATPCACGHPRNVHGASRGCWRCDCAL